MDGRLSSFEKNSHQNFFIKRVFSQVLYKTNFGVLKFKLNDFLKKNQHIYTSFNTNFLDQHDIKVALHNFFEKIDSFLVVQHDFWLV